MSRRPAEMNLTVRVTSLSDMTHASATITTTERIHAAGATEMEALASLSKYLRETCGLPAAAVAAAIQRRIYERKPTCDFTESNGRKP